MPARWTIVCWLAFTGLCYAAERRVPTSQRGVDVVTTADGQRMLGVVVARDERGGAVVAVRRAWLDEHLPERAKAVALAAERERIAAEDRRLARIAEWRRRRADHAGLVRFLTAEERRLREAAEEPAATPTSEFVLVRLPRTEVQRVYVQPASRRRVALLAWREGLPNVEDRATDALFRELRRRNVTMPSGAIDLSDRLPADPATRGDEATWAARVAVLEYLYVEPLDFQGTGNVLIRTTGRDQQPGLEELLAAFAKPAQRLDLLDLLDPPKGGPAAPIAKPLDTAIKEAEARGLLGFRATRVEPDLAGKRVRVESRFVARLPRGWTTVWRDEVTADASQPRPELERDIAEDERVDSLLKAIGAVGLGNDVATTAVRFGAATMAAQSDADDAFFDFTQSAGDSLDAARPTNDE